MIFYDNVIVPASCYGYSNIGVICWWNSMIQTLLGCSALHQVFKDPAVRGRNNLTQVFGAFLDNPRSPDGALQVLREFLLSLRNTGESRTFGSSQEDCNEGFLKFLDHLRSPEVDYIFKSRYQVWMTCSGCGNKKPLAYDTNVFIEFDNCETITWKDILAQSTPTDFPCQNCGGSMTHHRRLVAIPEIVILLFRKYNGKKLISVPAEFNVSGVGTYRLIGTNEHYGGTGGGHYTATTRRCGECWNANDGTIVKIDNLSAGANTYMVWYHVFN